MTMQAEDVAITEEDLELIKERETNIRQLEVSLSTPSWLLASTKIYCHVLGTHTHAIAKLNFLSVSFVSVWHHGCKSDIQGPGSDDPRSGRDDWWVALRLLFSGFSESHTETLGLVIYYSNLHTSSSDTESFQSVFRLLHFFAQCILLYIQF